MRLPRFRLRTLIIAVAVTALLMYGRRMQQHRQGLAALCGAAARGALHTGAVYRLDIDTETLRAEAPGAPAHTQAEIERWRRRSAYWVGLKQKYDRAATLPWLLVAPDPPPPE
jgi:hypothetical protein